VRIGLRADEIAKQPLRPGLSTVTAIDVRSVEKSPNAALTEASSSEYKTVIFHDDLAKAKERAEQIINDNLTLKEEAMEQACPSAGWR
jgi:membrane fusion protein (multidrug efflux system)